MNSVPVSMLMPTTHRISHASALRRNESSGGNCMCGTFVGGWRAGDTICGASPQHAGNMRVWASARVSEMMPTQTSMHDTI
jgi:hypothetical protein